MLGEALIVFAVLIAFIAIVIHFFPRHWWVLI